MVRDTVVQWLSGMAHNIFHHDRLLHMWYTFIIMINKIQIICNINNFNILQSCLYAVVYDSEFPELNKK